MNGGEVKVLEDELEAAIARVVRRLARAKQIHAPPPDRTYHLMAKAAAAVLEAVADDEGE
jgi:hypothetical protein